LYGEESNWLANLRDGGGHVIRAGRTFVVGPPEVVETRAAGSPLERLSPLGRAYCRLAEKLAVLELKEQLPGFGKRNVGPEGTCRRPNGHRHVAPG
jgi:hypothetical protein